MQRIFLLGYHRYLHSKRGFACCHCYHRYLESSSVWASSGEQSVRLRKFLELTLCDIAKPVLIAGNCPPLRKSELEYYAMPLKTTVHYFAGTSVTLGTDAGKLFQVGV